MNMPKRVRYFFGYLFSFFTVLILFVFCAQRVSAEETSNAVDWTNVKFTDVEDIDTTNNVVLFLGDECEACDALYTSIQTFNLNKYFSIQIVNGHSDEAKEVMKSLLEKHGYSTDPLVLPVLFHQDYATVGYMSCNAYLQALDRLKSNEAWLAHVQSVAKEIYEQEKAETENQSIIQIIKQLDLGTLIILGVSLALVIAGVVVLVVKKDQFHMQWRVALSLMEICLLGGSLVFFVNLANSKRQYIPDESLAGCTTNSSGVFGCDSWAELKTWQAQNSPSEATRREAARVATQIYGGDSWKDVSVGTTPGDSKNSTSVVLQQGYNAVVETSEALKKAEALSPVLKFAVEECQKNGGSDGKNTLECISDSAKQAYEITTDPTLKNLTGEFLQQSSPSDYVVVQFKSIIGDNKLKSICDTVAPGKDINKCAVDNSDKIISTYNTEVLTKYRSSTSGFTLAMDPITKTIIKNPRDISIVEDVCTTPTGGGDKTKGNICVCDSGVITRYNTSGGTTCEVVCRARALTCEACNPPVEEPKVTVSTTSGSPYCGDGILGNTSGEQCEKGDPSGVKCSWAACSDCKCPEVTKPYCGDGKINVTGEQCELGNPSGTSCKWDACNKSNCKCVTPGCGDGKLDTGEKCERGDPTGYTCKWDDCNQLKCQCVEPGCGDGKLDTGEKCEKGNPTGSTCLWEECNKSSCTCEVKESESCGDGKIQEGEQCEQGDPSGSSCTWDKCSKSTCMCPVAPATPAESYPQTSIFDTSYMRNIIIGGTLLILGILFYPMAQFIDNMYITVGNKALKIGRYVTRPDEVNRNRKKKKIEDSFK